MHETHMLVGAGNLGQAAVEQLRGADQSVEVHRPPATERTASHRRQARSLAGGRGRSGHRDGTDQHQTARANRT
jgi:predicted dinucleotide-binding enzyme